MKSTAKINCNREHMSHSEEKKTLVVQTTEAISNLKDELRARQGKGYLHMRPGNHC